MRAYVAKTRDGDPRYPPSTDWLVDDDDNQELTEISPAPTIISTKCTWFFGGHDSEPYNPYNINIE